MVFPSHFSPSSFPMSFLFLYILLRVLDVVNTLHVLKRLRKKQIYGGSRTFCLLTCDGYQNAEKQVGQLRLSSSSSSSSSPKPDDDEKIEVEEEAEEVDKLLGTFPVLAIVFSICLPWAEFTLITALGFILASFFFWAIFIFVFGVIFSETISMSSSSSKRFCDPLPGDCLGGFGFFTEVVTWMLYFSSFSCKQN